MEIRETSIKDCLEITTNIFEDERGYFHVPYFRDVLDYDFIQDNESYSVYGTIRGIHFQRGDKAQTKLVRCPYGKVLDVVVDLRPDSNTYLKVLTFELFTPHKMILVPKGCGHGFSVLSNEALFTYKVDEPYNKDSEGGINYADPRFAIDWRLRNEEIIISKKDKDLPIFF